MRLSREFGCPDVDRFLNSISSDQLNEWIALREQEPWGDELFYRFMAHVAARICQTFGGQISAEEFLPNCWREKMSRGALLGASDFAALVRGMKPNAE